jgi:hypothetical protein
MSWHWNVFKFNNFCAILVRTARIRNSCLKSTYCDSEITRPILIKSDIPGLLWRRRSNLVSAGVQYIYINPRSDLSYNLTCSKEKAVNVYSPIKRSERGSSVSLSRRPGFDLRQRQKIFPLRCASTPALGPPGLLYSWYPGSFPGGGG